MVVADHAHLAAVDLGDCAAVELGRGMDVDVTVDADHRADETRHESEIVGHEDDCESAVELLQQFEEVLLDLLVEAKAKRAEWFADQDLEELNDAFEELITKRQDV
jgi:methyl coenzyme M reductase beta subunit